MIGNNYKVDAISKPLADDFLQRHHYLAQQGKGFMGLVNYGLFDARGSFVGCVVFSGISVIETLIGCFDGFTRESDQSGFYELARLAMDDEKKERNLTSWFLARCIRKLRHENYVRAIISYADSKYHNGYIYQATNFHYYGLTDQKTDFFVNVGGVQRQVTRGAVKDIDGEWIKRSRKHRYLLVYDKSLNVKWEEKPYPKGDNNEYQLHRPEMEQMNIFDFIN